MALENLKSIFNEEAGINNSEISGRYNKDNRVEPMESIFGERTSAVDFFSGDNSYKPTLDPAVSGFTKFFNFGGYAYGDGQLGDSKYLNVSSDTQNKRQTDVDLTDLITENLGYGQYSSESMFGEFTNDIRFTLGMGWPFSDTILQVSSQGNQASLFYTFTNGFVSVGASGAFSNFGPISDVAESLGINLPNYDFNTEIFSPEIPTYTDSIWELNNFTPFDNTEPLPPGYLGNQRGIAFQTIYPNVNYSNVVANTSPQLGPISTMSDLFLGPQPSELQRTNASAAINEVSTGLHFYLGNQTSFVKLGALVYSSIGEALAAGDVGYVQDQLMEFGQDIVGNIIDTTGDMAQTIGNNLAEMASSFSIQTEVPDFNFTAPSFGNIFTSTGTSSFSFLSQLRGPSDNLPSFASLGGFFGELSIKNISFPAFDFESPFSVGLSDTQAGQAVSSFASSVSDFGSSILGGASSFISEAGSSVLGFFESAPLPRISISFNPDVQDLFNNLSNDTNNLQNNLQALTNSFLQNNPLIGGASEAGSLLSQQINADNAGADGSLDPYENPRGLIPKQSSVIEPQAPYRELGNIKYTDTVPFFSSKHVDEDDTNTRFSGELGPNNTILSNDVDNKYTDGIVSKHTDNSDEPKTPFDFYPTTLHGGDKKTLLPVKEGDSLSSINETLGGETYDEIAEGTKNGMPFYFKDLRTNPGTYVIFRGYLEGGITQELQPNWSEHQYLGRSESVYVYGNTKRTIAFTLATFSQTEDEMHTIYEKLGYLTKMTYPEYQQDKINNLKNRMIPPYVSLRIGDLFGSNRQNLQGFIDSLSFNWEDQSPWETKSGMIAPKKCSVTVNFAVIHRSPPERKTPQSEIFGVHH